MSAVHVNTVVNRRH